ncbi:RdRP-domain-containing protein [Mycena floridula]|nr:RdRP-domain-containing protein [Mycena floridula]
MERRGLKKEYVTISTTKLRISNHGESMDPIAEEKHPSFRAARMVDDATRFLIVSAVIEKNTNVLPIIQKLIREGFTAPNGVKYTWLGYSESQLKANQFTLFREGRTREMTVKRLLDRIGELEAVYLKSGYGKYAARLGLSFSSTAVGLQIPLGETILIPELFAKDGSVASDGIGLIRNSKADELCVFLGIEVNTSAFQIRLGGIKGIVARCPDVRFDQIVGRSGKVIAYRPSMKKFSSTLTDLEICGVSRRRGYARLNVQFILLFLSLGIPLSTFKELLQEQLDDIALFMQDRRKAKEILDSTDVELDADGQGYYQDLWEMILAGHDLEEPFLHAQMERFQNQRYRHLHEKLNMDVKKSCRLYGVVDEHDVLKDDEVYINIPERTGVQIGPVAVSRNPAYATGDIRVLQAVSKPELCHLVNCIVFPANCARSIPDTMGGGDLDGDEYWITWDPRLVPVRADPPQSRVTDNTSVASSSRKRTDMTFDAATAFADLRSGANGLLGQMSKEWERATEQSRDYARSVYSRALVPLIEQAMDICKQGNDPVALRRKFDALLKRSASTRASNSPLEALRKIIPEPGSNKMKHHKPDPELNIREDDPEVWDKCYKEAASHCGVFGQAVSIAIDKDDQTDDMSQNGRQESRDKYKNEVRMAWIARHFSARTTTQKAYERIRASAWYYYGYANKKPMFAWLGARWLNHIKAEATNEGRAVLSVGRLDRPLNPSLVESLSAATNSSRTSTTIFISNATPPHASSVASSDTTVVSRPRRQVVNESISRAAPPSSSISTAAPPSSATNDISSRTPLPRTSTVTRAALPQVPVSTTTPECQFGRPHDWICKWANGTTRHYICKLCPIFVKEKLSDRSWRSDTMITNINRT